MLLSEAFIEAIHIFFVSRLNKYLVINVSFKEGMKSLCFDPTKVV